LARADATTIEVARDITYRLPMSYRAVQVAALLAGMTLPPDSVIEAVALDGFVAQLPPDLMLNTDNSKAVAWLAIEPADHPWPPIPGSGHERGTVLHCLDRGRRRQHPKRAMAVSCCKAGEVSLRPHRAGLPSPSVLRCHRQIRPAPAKFCSPCSASPVTS
jgi:hypothetical protein